MSDTSFLIISRHPPYTTHQPREGLDAALTSAVFEQPVAMLFLADGVWQLLKGQRPEALGQKNLSSNLQVLPMYDIEHIYVCAQALAERGLTEEQLVIPVKALDKAEISTLLRQHNRILSF